MGPAELIDNLEGFEPIASLPQAARVASEGRGVARYAYYRTCLRSRHLFGQFDAAPTRGIEDDGIGFSPEVLERLGEPYVSDRHQSGGLGLGIFIAETLLARTGATLQFGDLKAGARVTIRWTRAALEGLASESLHD